MLASGQGLLDIRWLDEDRESAPYVSVNYILPSSRGT